MISRPCPQGCPCEDDAPAPAPCPVYDSEDLVKVAFARPDDFEEVDGGVYRFSPGAFRSEDIRGDGRGKKSVSVIREHHLPANECWRRAALLEPKWSNDPVVGRVTALEVRALTDNNAPRLLCVYADPTGDEDRHGPLPSHAGIVRARPIPRDHQRMEILKVKVAIAEVFGILTHLSGRSASDTIDALRGV